MLGTRNFPIAKSLSKERGARFMIFCRNCFASQYRNISYGNLSLLRLRKVAVAKKVKGEEGGGISKLSVDFFCLTVPKKLVGESFTISLISVIEKS